MPTQTGSAKRRFWRTALRFLAWGLRSDAGRQSRSTAAAGFGEMPGMTRAPTPLPVDPGPDLTDGRRRRGHDNRARIVSAMMEIVRAGEIAPSAEQVAARADVGLRTVFRHFQDMDSLYREIAAVIGAEVRANLQRPFRAEAWRDRLIEMVGRRAVAFEKMAPFKHAADAFRRRSKVLGSDYARMIVELREVLERQLPRELARDRNLVETLDMLLSFEAWSRLRREQGLPPKRAQAVLEAAVSALIA
jgi:AcrR family transcriptional regulator